MKKKKIEFYKDLYIGETVKHPEKIMKKIKKNAGQLNIYVIVPANGNDLLEIYHAGQLKMPYYKKNPPLIVGIANGYDEALKLMECMIMDCFTKTGDFKIKEILYNGL